MKYKFFLLTNNNNHKNHFMIKCQDGGTDMKATGIVRRIDDLGRVVIPKEIRRTLRIREGDPLEIFTDREGEIILKKYSPIGELGQFAKQYADSLAQTTGHIVVISDKDQFVAAAGSTKKDLISKPITHELELVINERDSLMASKDDKHFVRITSDDETEYTYEVIWPIISEGDAIGSVIILSKDPKVKFGEVENKLASTAAAFLGRQMEQ
ncbi:MAG: spoVT [Lachnospiraceae bacterium]|jgi:AbrB family transcriptional regulator (stage V sporulation protein T)|nr:spoVT [Lachnospiraceae bacterium]